MRKSILHNLKSRIGGGGLLFVRDYPQISFSEELGISTKRTLKGSISSIQDMDQRPFSMSLIKAYFRKHNFKYSSIAGTTNVAMPGFFTGRFLLKHDTTNNYVQITPLLLMGFNYEFPVDTMEDFHRKLIQHSARFQIAREYQARGFNSLNS